MVGGDDDRVGDCHGGLVCSAAAGDALVAGRQERAFGVCRCSGGFDQGAAQVAGTVAGAGWAAFAGRLVGCGATPAQAARCRRWGPGHVDADLGDDRLGGEVSDPGDCLEQFDRCLERDETLDDLVGEGVDGGVEEVDVAEI